MLDKLTRYIRGLGPPAPGTAGAADPINGTAEPRAGAGAIGTGAWARPPSTDGWAVRDLVVEGAAAPALREVFAQERQRSGSGQVITLYDPQRAFAPVLPRLVEALRGAAGDRIRLIDSRTRKVLAVIDRALLGTGGNVLRLLEVDIAGAERPSAEVPLTLIEQSDVAAVLLGSQPEPALLESLLMTSLAPTWRCANLLLVVPSDAGTAKARLARYTWPAGTRTEPVVDPVAELPPLWTAALRRGLSPGNGAGPGDNGSHADRISQMLASVAAPVAPAKPTDSALTETTVPGVMVARGQPRPPEATIPMAATAALPATLPAAAPLAAALAPAPAASTAATAAVAPAPSAAAASPAPAMAATALPLSALPTTQPPATAPRPIIAPAREPGPEVPMPASTPRPEPDRALAAAASRGPKPTETQPQRSLPPGELALQALEPLMRLPGAIAAATVDLRDARMVAQLGTASALTATQPAIMLGCRPLATSLGERNPRVDEWIWSAGGRLQVLQPLPRDPLTAVLIVLDADRADLAMTRWSCTVARNSVDREAAGAAPAARTDTALGASSGR
jgi:hypothetical protein